MVFLISCVDHTAGVELTYSFGGYPPGTGHNAWLCQVCLCKWLSKSVHCVASIKIFFLSVSREMRLSQWMEGCRALWEIHVIHLLEVPFSKGSGTCCHSACCWVRSLMIGCQLALRFKLTLNSEGAGRYCPQSIHFVPPLFIWHHFSFSICS